MSTASAAAGWAAWSDRRSTGAGRTITRGRRRVDARQRWLPRVIVAGLAITLGLALLLVWVRLQVVRTGYDLSTAQQLERKLEHQGRELELELAALTSPRRLEAIARERLGMRPPAAGQVLSVP